MTRLRSGALLLGVWIGFFALQPGVSLVLAKHGPANLRVMVENDLVLAVLWAALSAGIAAWHRRVRAIATDVFTVIALHLPTLVLATLIDCAVTRIAWQIINDRVMAISFPAMLVLYADFDIVAYVGVVAIAEALLVRRALVERQRLAKRLEASLSRARLDYLEAQLQPHFLFNSLGAVSELAFDAPATASRVLRQLTAIFRTALAKKSDEVTLGEEIVGIEPYLDIQRIRFADWLTIDYHVDDEAVDCLLPRFVLQPLVENAIRHGLSGRSAAGRIDISATVEGGSLLVRVTDNGVGLDAASASAGRGIGLTNVRDRLAILYNDDDLLHLYDNSTGGTIAELTVPARRRSDAPVTPADGSTPVVAIGDTDLRVLQMPKLFRRPAVANAVIWLAWGLIWTQQSIAYEMLRPHSTNPSWLSEARTDMTSALIWAVLTPLVLLLGKRFPIRRRLISWRILVYLGAAVATTLAHVALLEHLARPDLALSSPSWQIVFIVDFAIFGLLVAIGHRGVLLEWLRAREMAAAVLTAELATAQSRAAKLQVIPPVLLNSLDGIAETVRHDPARTERQLARLADYLRLALECTDDRGVTPDRERALEVAVAALRDSGAFTLDLTLSA
jgi:two-component system LytT family sensor kinase